jgi:hypothetical protein
MKAWKGWRRYWQCLRDEAWRYDEEMKASPVATDE